MTTMTTTTIAMDGPAASGKTTVGRLLAEQLGYVMLDTGFMYRAVTLAALNAHVSIDDETAVTQLASQISLDVKPIGEENDGRLYTALLNNQDVTWDLRTPDVDQNVSQVSSYAGVRQEMVKRQRKFGQQGNIVMIGRDIGTVVMPDAPLKVYITASAEERAHRRWRDRQEQGLTDRYEIILADVKRRDEIDSNRQHSPLRPADDAIIIDTTNRAIDDIVHELVRLAQATPS